MQTNSFDITFCLPFLPYFISYYPINFLLNFLKTSDQDLLYSTLRPLTVFYGKTAYQSTTASVNKTAAFLALNMYIIVCFIWSSQNIAIISIYGIIVLIIGDDLEIAAVDCPD